MKKIILLTILTVAGVAKADQHHDLGNDGTVFWVDRPAAELNCQSTGEGSSQYRLRIHNTELPFYKQTQVTIWETTSSGTRNADMPVKRVPHKVSGWVFKGQNIFIFVNQRPEANGFYQGHLSLGESSEINLVCQQ